MKQIATVLAAVLAAVLGVAAVPPMQAAADTSPGYTDPYTQPGGGIINGREWRTTCGQYSTTVDRCRAEIKATQIKFEDGRFVEVNDWVFNNLTYLPVARTEWAGNPLAANGVVGDKAEWTATDGRQWRTECDTTTTGRNGCRSYVWSRVNAIKTMTPRTYEQRDEWVFNNVVLFTTPKPAPPQPAPPVYCNDTALPSGFALTKDGRPHAVNTPYSPNTLYNPTSISNFIKSTINLYNAEEKKSKGSARAKDLRCLAELGADHLLKGSETTTSGAGQTVRWFPYMFPFSANPTMAPLKGPWHSGLAQGGVLSTFVSLASLTGDNAWLEKGAETFRSFEVPIDEPGGILNRNEEFSFLWFEEYPTTPLPTTVLNGHLEALIGLDTWHRRMVAAGARAVTPPAEIKALIDEALDTLEPMLSLHEVDIDGGLLTSYDAVRGLPASPLRFKVDRAQDVVPTRVTASLNGDDLTVPVTADSWRQRVYVQNGGFTDLDEQDQRTPQHWSRFGQASNAYVVPESTGDGIQGNYVEIVSGNDAWQGFQQSVPPSWLTGLHGTEMSITLRAAVHYPRGKAGASGRVAIFNDCPQPDGPNVRSLRYENVLRGSGEWNDYTFGFTAPTDTRCGMLVQLMISPYTNKGTVVQIDDFNISTAQPVGVSVTPEYDIRVYATPHNTLTLTGSGTGVVQAYKEGRWHDIKTVTLADEVQDVVIPERFTGRNIHLGYHETHVSELTTLYNRFPDREFLRVYAERWAPMSPSRHHLVPAPKRAGATGTVSPMGLETTVIAGETLLVPEIVDQFTGLPYDEFEFLDELQQPAS